MAMWGFDELCRDADERRPRVPVAVAGSADPTVLEALRSAQDRGWIAAALCGREADLRQTAAALDISLDGFIIHSTDTPGEAAVAEVRAGRARMLMKGQIATPALLHAVLAPEKGLRSGRVICQVVLMEIRTQEAAGVWRRLLLADTGICLQPTLAQKIDILQSCVEVAHALGVDLPRVAAMAATETVAASMPETLDAAELQRQNQVGDIPGCLVQGPLSFDLAYAPQAAGKKRVEGAVAGAADVLLFPSLLSANLTVKAIMYTAPCRFGGILCGTTCPVVFMSRADTAQTRLHSLALAVRIAANPGVWGSTQARR